MAASCRWSRCTRRRVISLVAGVAAVGVLAVPALAHGGSLGSAGRESVAVPTWLVLLTGGAAVGASFLLASLVTDRSLIAAVESWSRGLIDSGAVLRWGARVVSLLGLVVLAVVLFVASMGPQQPLANLGLLTVWVGWWAGYTMSTYLVGNTWPALNPWRTLSRVLPSLSYSYPERLGVWPATVALLALVWVEVVSPVADQPDFLAGVIIVYTAVTLLGTLVFGTQQWFDSADPVARVFDHYGRVAPFGRDRDTISLQTPGSALADIAPATRSEVAFVIALLWVTTFDGFVSTPAWRSIVDVVPVPLSALYPLALVAGFGLFLAAFYGAARASKRITGTCVTTASLVREFAPSLLAIAAGYHLAHYLGYFISLLPALATVATAPLAPPAEVTLLVAPDWFETVGMLAILVGHFLAIWVAHATAFDIFPGRLQAIRSQYPFIAVMVFYTMTSLWILAQPEVAAP